jgi:hypothetical protein
LVGTPGQSKLPTSVESCCQVPFNPSHVSSKREAFLSCWRHHLSQANSTGIWTCSGAHFPQRQFEEEVIPVFSKILPTAFFLIIWLNFWRWK